MIGSGKASSAVTVVNAFATGMGAAIAIDLWTYANVEILNEEKIEMKITVRGKEMQDIRLVKGAVDTLRSFTGASFGVRGTIESEIPVAKGLKSSSAAANALISAMLNAMDIQISPMQLLKLSVEAARRSGVTVTGAMDDAATSYLGGLCIANNKKDELISRSEVEKLPVVLLVPAEEVLSEDLKNMDFSPLAPYVEKILQIASNGEWRRALVLNGLIYSAYLGYSPEPIKMALEMKAVAGLCGKGPAFFAITRDPELIAEEWSALGEIVITELR